MSAVTEMPFGDSLIGDPPAGRAPIRSAAAVPVRREATRHQPAPSVRPRLVLVRASTGADLPRSALARQAPARPAAAPLRLTRRGRAVVAAAATVLAAVAASLIVVAAATGAQATNHGQPGGGYAGMREIVVRPGQTLWSIAAAAEPSADPRVVIQQIMTVNSLTTTQIQAGQLLWVPK